VSVDVAMPDVHTVPAVHLRSGGVSLVLDQRGSGLPAIAYWGADLGEVSADELAALLEASDGPVGDSRIDVPEQVSVLPLSAEGWIGRPGILGSRAGESFSPLFSGRGAEDGGTDSVVAASRHYQAVDSVGRLELGLDIQLTSSGLVRMRAQLKNAGASEYQLDGLTLTLPVPTRANELLDFAGRHARERIPQRSAFTVGTHLRESRQGRPGLDSAYLLAAGVAGFSWESGEVWGLHTAWSGNQVAYAERMYNGVQLLGAGELPLPGEIRLRAGESYESPWIYGSFGIGLNEVAQRFHRYLRARPQHPARPRPVLINTWEAVYFDHNLSRLVDLASHAAEAGVERFVLDDGWFIGRRNDEAGLGDWFVDRSVWPDGLTPIIEAVNDLGMEFGLWVEPEMINLESELARKHPEWIFRAGGRVGLPSRQQYVLDLGHPEAYDYIASCIFRLLDEYPTIRYLKWDHNRVVIEAGHSPSGRPGVHNHTAAVYRLMDEIKTRFPGIEIESCAGGGGRIDLGIIERTDRVWASDCIDALERQQIQRYTQLLLPPELIGTHLGDAEAHTTHRRHHLGFRASTAIWGHMGIEWDLTKVSQGKLDEVSRWVAFHKEIRGLLHSGDVYVGDHADPAIWVHGVVATDKSDAVFQVTSVARPVTFPPGRVCLPGLDPDQLYQVTSQPPGDRYPERVNYPAWWEKGVALSGRTLATVGVQVPAIFPEYSYLIRVRTHQAAS
jgi:alpha-galactosidase